MRHGSILGSIGVGAVTGPLASLIGRMRISRIACTMIRRTRIMLTPTGRLLPLILVTIPPIGIPLLVPLPVMAIPAVSIARVLLPLALVAIPAVGIAVGLMPRALRTIPAVVIAVGLMPLTLMTIPAIVIAAGLVPLTVLAIPTIGMAAWLLPLMRLPIPGVSMASRLVPLMVLAIAIGMAAWLLELMRLPIHDVSMATLLGRSESLTIRLRGKRTIRPGLGAQRAQSHKQTQCKNNGPPSFWSHLIILL